MSELTQTAMDADAARRLTERIRIAAVNYSEAKEKLLRLVSEAKDGSAHVALGYASWTAYLADVMSEEPLRLARDERREVVQLLSDEGVPPKVISPIVGVSDRRVRQLRSQGGNYFHPEPAPTTRSAPSAPSPAPTPTKVTGMDGKAYSRPAPAPQPEAPKPKRRPLAEQAQSAEWELVKAIERVERIVEDDRFAANKEVVTPHLRSHLTNAIDSCQGLLDRISNY